MRKSGIFIFGAALSFAFTFGSYGVIRAQAEERTVYVGGMSAGFTLKTGGAQLIGTCEVISENGASCPAQNAKLRAGDCIYKAAGIKVDSVSELNEIVNKTQGKEIELEVGRGGETFTVKVQPVKDKTTNRYKIGVLIRDSVSGIGTVTYIDKTSGRFGALGHSVVGENKKEMQISNGTVYECSIVGVAKGVRGKAGELRGMFLNDKELGNAEKLCDCGIFGSISSEFEVDEIMQMVASSEDVKPGNAYIYSTVNGIHPKKYDIEIVKVDKHNKENKIMCCALSTTG